MKRLTGAALIVMLLTSFGGCWTTNFPYMTSMDRHNFASTPTRPLNVKLKDVVTGEYPVDVDVPVDMKLVIDIEHDGGSDSPTATGTYAPIAVEWEVLKADTMLAGELANKIELQRHPVMLVVTVRDLKPDEIGAPAYQPVEGDGASPAYTPAGPATREISEPEAPASPAVAPGPAVRTETPATTTSTGESGGTTAPAPDRAAGSPYGASDAPPRTPRYTPQNPEPAPDDTGDLEGALE